MSIGRRRAMMANNNSFGDRSWIIQEGVNHLDLFTLTYASWNDDSTLRFNHNASAKVIFGSYHTEKKYLYIDTKAGFTSGDYSLSVYDSTDKAKYVTDAEGIENASMKLDSFQKRKVIRIDADENMTGWYIKQYFGEWTIYNMWLSDDPNDFSV